MYTRNCKGDEYIIVMAKSDDWSTPPTIMKVLDDEFHFTLEVCAAADNRALPHVPYLGLDNGKDALQCEWFEGKSGVAYPNPPYSKLPQFIYTACVWSMVANSTVVMLIPVYTDTSVWHDCIKRDASEVRFLRGRLAFLMNGKKQTTARFPSAVVVFKGPPTAKLSLWDWKENLK